MNEDYSFLYEMSENQFNELEKMCAEIRALPPTQGQNVLAKLQGIGMPITPQMVQDPEFFHKIRNSTKTPMVETSTQPKYTKVTSKRPIRDTIIQEDELTNLKIDLNNNITVDDFINKYWN